MCGILGFVDKKNQYSNEERRTLGEKLLTSIEHRGRDGYGIYQDGPVLLGHARLSILDTSEAGAEPFLDAEESVVVSYNGEIYNFKELNRELEEKYQLRSECDVETLVYSYREKGERCPESFNGMFAFSLYDRKRQRVMLAIDRFGIKPLYFINTPEWFAWSSEIKTLLLLPGISARLNETKLSEYFVFRQVAGSETLFAGIERVLPAQIITLDLHANQLGTHKYWHLTQEPLVEQNETEIETALLEQLRQSVREHLLADVPVGIQLSGGIDSSLVVALASEEIKNLNTYSIGLAQEGWNEFSYSRAVAKKFGTIHHEITFTEDEFCRSLPLLIYHHDEPISHSHSVPMFLLARKAREKVKVLLSGEGADEVFFGYRRYQKLFEQGVPTSEAIMELNAFIAAATAARVLPSFKASEAYACRQELIESVKSEKLSWVQETSLYDLATYLPSLLLRQDKMGMAATLENRVPFLDHRLVTFGFSLPDLYKISKVGTKLLLKKVASRFLPHDLVYRPKVGFSQPIKEWLTHEKGFGRYLSFFEQNLPRRSFLDYAQIDQLIQEHRSGEANNTEILWTLINFELWMRIFIDNERPEAIVEELYGST